jgi:hypothetical protein
MGAFVCTLSEEDWQITRELGIYGNRYFKERTENPFNKSTQLSIIRDLIAMREGDYVFFHLRRRKTIHGVYRVRKAPYFDNKTKIWSNDTELFPFRFLFEPHPDYEYLTNYDANIEVHSLYEYIDKGTFRSLVTLENEQNIEARSVRKILKEDAELIIKLLHRDFKFRKRDSALKFIPYNPIDNVTPLKFYIDNVGRYENAIKAVIMYELAYNPTSILSDLSKNMNINYENFDFINEFFIAQTTRKAVDIYARDDNYHIIFEVKTDRVDEKALQQALYYKDLLLQRLGAKGVESSVYVLIIGQRFSNKLIDLIKKLNTLKTQIYLIEYIPVEKNKWAVFNYVY